MTIICSSYSTTISSSNSLVCGYLIKISDIRPTYEDIEVLIDNIQWVTFGNVAIQYNKVIFSFHLISKNIANNTAVIDMIESSNPCIGIVCPDTCVGVDLYAQQCMIDYDASNIPIGYTCVPDTLKNANDPLCSGTANAYIEFYIKPPSNKTIHDVYLLVTGMLSNIINVVTDTFSGITGVTYIDSIVIEEPTQNRVTYRVNYHDDNISLSQKTKSLLAPVVIPMWFLVTLIGGILITSGLLIYGYFFGEKKDFSRSDITKSGKDITNECAKNADIKYPNWKTNATEFNARVSALQICNISIGETLADPKYLDNPLLKTNAENTNAEMQKQIDCLNNGTCTINEAVAEVEKVVETVNNNYETIIEYYEQLDACFNIPFIGCMNTNELIVYGIVGIGGILVVSNILTSSSRGYNPIIIEKQSFMKQV